MNQLSFISNTSMTMTSREIADLVDSRHDSVGYFDTPEEAHAAYMAAKSRLHIGGRSH